jgi:hypothetical protein
MATEEERGQIGRDIYTYLHLGAAQPGREEPGGSRATDP